jgi:cyclic pyranopterin phosphate synthase
VRTAIVNITARCNQQCVFCLERDPAAPVLAEPDTREACAQLDDLWRRGARHVTFMGGETLLRQDAVEIIAHARELGFTRICVATNGTALAREGYLHELVAHGLEHLELSLHGHTSELANAISGRPFTHARQARALAELDALGAPPTIVNLVVCRENRDALLDVVRYVAERCPRVPLRFKLKFVSLQGAALAAARQGGGLSYAEVDAVGLGDALAAGAAPFWFYNFPLCRLGDHARQALELQTLATDEQYFDRAVSGAEDYYDSAYQLSGRVWPEEPCAGCTVAPLCPGVEADYWRVHAAGGGLAPRRDDATALLAETLREAGGDPTEAAERLAALARLPRPGSLGAVAAGGRDPAAAAPHGAPQVVHLDLGTPCNNGCLLCDAGRAEPASGLARWVRATLAAHAGAAEVWVTGGEPTSDPRLHEYAAWARELGYRVVGVVTNGRRLAYPRFTERLVRAGVTRFAVSVHGHEASLHDELTRTPGSFDQTVRGIELATRLGAPGLGVRTTTVVTRQSLPHLPDIYRLLRGLGVDEIAFRPLRPRGRAAEHFAQLAVQYRDLAAAFRALLEGEATAHFAALLLGVPACVTRGISERCLDRSERTHPAATSSDGALMVARWGGAGSDPAARGGESPGRRQRAECTSCAAGHDCDGVWDRYLDCFGWDELTPLARPEEA